ncbi:MAG: RNA 3'-terminal phosphate cyclase [Verrucomicrobiales bacterium]
MSTLLTLNGDAGGGQLLRSALTLSLVTGRAFRMTGIRSGRPKPGLMRQHLTGIHAAAAVGEARVEGAGLHSQELEFRPRTVSGGHHAFAIGTGGSTTLVLQTILPALVHAPEPSSVRIEGGTHNPMAPPFEFIDECYLPVLRTMGIKASVTLERAGFMQAGGGALTATIAPVRRWKKLQLTERGTAGATFGRVLHAHLPPDIARREIATAARLMEWTEDQIELRYVEESSGPGNAIMLGAHFTHVCEISTGVARVGISAESVATGAAKGLRAYLASPAPVGPLLADQLLLPMALAGGGVFHTNSITNHTRTNVDLIQRFLPVRFTIDDVSPGVRAVRADG